MDAAVRKICEDQAEGILLGPLRRNCPWFAQLGDIALQWWDLPPEEGLLHTACGMNIPPHSSYSLRAVLFNAAGYTPRESPQLRPSPWKDLAIDWEFPDEEALAQIRSVIASTCQHPDAIPFVERIQHYFHDELHSPKLARDVDPAVRGPFGVAKIELKESGRPLARKPFRTLGLREAALKEIIDKYLARGWIRPSKSEWAAQAFVVPKPDTPDQQTK